MGWDRDGIGGFDNRSPNDAGDRRDPAEQEASRVRQVSQLHKYIAREVPDNAALLVAGDFNDWGARISRMMQSKDLQEWQTNAQPTYPSRLPIVQLDHVYAKGLSPVSQMVPHGKIWRQMSDHLPLVAQFDL